MKKRSKKFVLKRLIEAYVDYLVFSGQEVCSIREEEIIDYLEEKIGFKLCVQDKYDVKMLSFDYIQKRFY